MSGNYHFGGNPNQPYVNGTNAHNSGSLVEDTSIPIPRGGFYGPVSNVVAASGNASSSYGNIQTGQNGGAGYGMASVQDLLGGLNNRYPIMSSYQNVGVKNDLNLGVSTQYNPLLNANKSSGLFSLMNGGKGKRKMKAGRRGKGFFGGSNPISYGYDMNASGGSSDLSLYRGSYAPISVSDENKGMMQFGSNSNVSLQLGGKRRKSMRPRYKTKSKNGGRGRTRKHKRKMLKSRRYKKSRNGIKRGLKNTFKMSKKMLEKIVGGNGTCGAPQSSTQPVNVQSGGGYSQYLGGQEFSQGYSLNDLVTPQTSALANPMPFKPYNSCQ